MTRPTRRPGRWPLPLLEVLILGALLWPWGTPARDTRPLAARLLGPVASLVASVQWVRFDVAIQGGRFERGYSLAERALALDPRAPQGWMHLASHLAYFRASAENEPDPARRRQWIATALELLARGERESRDAAELAFMRGLVLYTVSELDGDQELGWPGGGPAAVTAAIRAFLDAGDLGHPRGYPMARILSD